MLEQDGRLTHWLPDGNRPQVLGGNRPQVIETAAAAVDLVEAELFGRTGLLVVHRGMQLRFYEPGGGGTRWPYREIYSFYTNSEQGGLLLRDIDRDGRPDILCGNYWVQAPAVFEESWRLFAINLFHEELLSASARLLWLGGRLLWVESKQNPARASWFTPPANPRELWREEPLGWPLRTPRGVVADSGRVWIAEAATDQPRIWEWPSGLSRPLPAPAAALLLRDGHPVIVDPEGVPHRLTAASGRSAPPARGF